MSANVIKFRPRRKPAVTILDIYEESPGRYSWALMTHGRLTAQCGTTLESADAAELHAECTLADELLYYADFIRPDDKR